MKIGVALICMAAATIAAQAQTAARPATASKTAAKTSTTARSAGSRSSASSAIKLPPGVPPARGIVKTAIALRYQDIAVGAGPVGEEGKLWHVKYTGWRAADRVKFDSWDEHKLPVIKDGKPEMGADGKPVLGDPKPMEFPHGVGRLIPGFDAGVDGMRVGGKRRLFIPYQLAYGNRVIPDRGPEHPGIPAKSDLIFDVELVEVTDMPQPPARPQFPAHPSTQPMPSPGPHFPLPTQKPATPGQPAAPAVPGTAPTTTTPPPAAAPATAPAAPSAPATPPQSKPQF